MTDIDTEPHWAILFAVDLVLSETSKAAVERDTERERTGVQGICQHFHDVVNEGEDWLTKT